MLETALKSMFDFQRFEPSTALQDVIDEVLDRNAQISPLALSDEDLALAAGGTRTLEENSQEPDYDGRGKI